MTTQNKIHNKGSIRLAQILGQYIGCKIRSCSNEEEWAKDIEFTLCGITKRRSGLYADVSYKKEFKLKYSTLPFPNFKMELKNLNDAEPEHIAALIKIIHDEGTGFERSEDFSIGTLRELISNLPNLEAAAKVILKAISLGYCIHEELEQNDLIYNQRELHAL